MMWKFGCIDREIEEELEEYDDRIYGSYENTRKVEDDILTEFAFLELFGEVEFLGEKYSFFELNFVGFEEITEIDFEFLNTFLCSFANLVVECEDFFERGIIGAFCGSSSEFFFEGLDIFGGFYVRKQFLDFFASELASERFELINDGGFEFFLV